MPDTVSNKKFTWQHGDLIFDEEVNIPINLKSIVDGLRKDGTDRYYLQQHVESGKLSSDMAELILHTTQKNISYIFE